ncbi:MAG TPA: penicillin-binding protein 1C [Cytophagaceae bacterium]|nr:penicillin-binding protein 1C [Cytophagaceae bacterium]
MVIHKLKKHKRKLYFSTLALAVVFFLFILLNFFFPFRIKVPYSQIILAADNSIIHTSLSSDDKWRMKTELHEIVPQLREALLYKEDRYFYYHPGFNPLAIGRALFNNIISGKKTSGASTITMQVVRLLEPRERTYGSKFIEIFRAMQLEWQLSKDEILQLYINLVPYGGNIEGVKSASVLYFGRMPNRLSLAQITALTIVPNRPTSLRPGRSNEYIKKERNRWLLQFREANLFPHADIEAALVEPLEANRLKAPKELPHLSNRLSAQYPEKDIILTCIHKKIQQQVEQISYNYLQRLRQKHIHNAAVLVLNNQTMEVEAYLGDPDFYDSEHAGQVDGIRAVRSPGSALKPLVYAMGFDEGKITPKTVLTDVPTDFNGYAPENFDKKFNGKVTVETALAYSLNIPAVKMLEEVTVPVFVQKLKNAGFKKIAKEEKSLGLSTILGGCGVTVEEMAGLYSAFANGGKTFSLRYLKTDTKNEKASLFSPMAAYMITDILIQITRPDLPYNYQSTYHVPTIAWKTGTSYGRRDAWSIGYNKKYTIAVWVGNFSGEGVPELTGADIATPLLFELFNNIEYNAANNWFFKPDDLKFRFVCPESGKLPGEYCEHTLVDYYIPNVSSAEQCAHVKPVNVDIEERYSYCNLCLPEGGYKKKLYPNLPSDLIDYYLSKGIMFAQIPEHNPRCSRIQESNTPTIISPLHNKEYIVDKEDPAELALKCNAHNDVKTVFWYINNHFYREASAYEKIFFKPTEGRCKISCSDDKGRNADIYIIVKYQ